MVGIIVTGHGTFATGMTSALRLIVGDVPEYRSVDFTSLDGTADLERDLRSAFEALSGDDGTLVLCDLVGGSPFKTAATIGAELGNVRLVAGLNLGSLIETCMSRTDDMGLDELWGLAEESARMSVIPFPSRGTADADASRSSDVDLEGDGI